MYLIFLFYVYEFYVCMYVYITYVCVACGGQKNELVPLELELQTVMSCHMHTGNWTYVLWESS